MGSDLKQNRVVTVLSISIHAPRVGSDEFPDVTLKFTLTISIHAPRVGSDGTKHKILTGSVISINAPRVGCDYRVQVGAFRKKEFQSTLPVWGATYSTYTSQ